VKSTLGPRSTTDGRLTDRPLPDRIALFGARPRGRGPVPRSLRRWAAAPQETPRLPRRNPMFGFPLNCTKTYK